MLWIIPERSRESQRKGMPQNCDRHLGGHPQEMKPVLLSILPDRLAICRLGPDEAVPEWALASTFHSITRTDEELSVVCAERLVPPRHRCEKGWRCLKVRGPLDFSQTGILASLTAPLAEVGISVFALSTYDTDYLLVKERDLSQALAALAAHGIGLGTAGVG